LKTFLFHLFIDTLPLPVLKFYYKKTYLSKNR